jgi:hypothetical protein
VCAALGALDRRLHVDRMLLQFLHHLRNMIVPVAEHAMLPIYGIWIDIQSAAGMADPSAALPRLCEMLKLHLSSTSISTLSSVVSEWKKVITPRTFDAADPQPPEEDRDRGSGDGLAACLAALHAQVCVLEGVLGGVRRAVLGSELCAAHDVTLRDSLRSIARKLPIHTEMPAPAPAPAPQSDPPSGSESGGAGGGGAPAAVCAVRVDDMLEFYLDDVFEAVVALASTVISLPRPHNLPGVVTMSPAAIALGNAYSNSNIRIM